MLTTRPTSEAEPRYVFDTNVLISALLFSKSTPRRAFDYARDHGKILVSKPLLEELLRVVKRPKFERYVTQAEREQFLAALAQIATLVTVTVQLQVVRDAKDNHVLELAVSGNATAIISSDQDLLVLGAYDSMPIQTPAEFLQRAAPPPPAKPTP